MPEPLRQRRFGHRLPGRAPLVLLHGFVGTCGDWDEVVAPLCQVGLGGLIVGLPGHEGRPMPPLPADPARAFVALVDHLAATLRTLGAGAPPCHLVGYSLGGRLGLGLALRHPELFCRATLIGAHPGLRRGRALRAAADGRWAAMLRREGLGAFLPAWLAQPLFASQRRAPPTRRQAFLRRRRRHDPLGLACMLQATSLAAMPNYWSQLGAAAVPLHWVAGGEDAAFAARGRRAARHSPTATFTALKRCGHSPLVEAPLALAAVLAAA